MARAEEAKIEHKAQTMPNVEDVMREQSKAMEQQKDAADAYTPPE